MILQRKKGRYVMEISLCTMLGHKIWYRTTENPAHAELSVILTLAVRAGLWKGWEIISVD